jgi:hypothetical protein
MKMKARKCRTEGKRGAKQNERKEGEKQSKMEGKKGF